MSSSSFENRLKSLDQVLTNGSLIFLKWPLTIKLLLYFEYKHTFYMDFLALSIPSTVFLSQFSRIALCMNVLST